MENNRANRIKQLETLLGKSGASPNKLESWRRELDNLKKPKERKNNKKQRPKNRELQVAPRSMRPSRGIPSSISSGVGVALAARSQSNPLEKQLELNIAKTISVMLDPDSGPVRLCDDVSSPTAVYKSVQEFVITANGAVDNGRFTVVLQPILGSNANPRSYKNGIVKCSSPGPNMAKSVAYTNFVDNVDVRVDPNLLGLMQPVVSQNTWSGTFPVSNTAALTDQHPTVTFTNGNNNSGFVACPSGSYSEALGFVPTRPLFKIPAGIWYSTILMNYFTTGFQGSWMNINNFHKIISQTQITQFSLRVYKIAYGSGSMPALTSAMDLLQLKMTGSAIGTGTIESIIQDPLYTGNIFKYATGGMGMPTGASSSANNDVGVVGNLEHYMVIPYSDDSAYYCEILMDNSPHMTTLNGNNQQFFWNITSSILSSEPVGYDSRSLVQKLRPTAMKAHLIFEAPTLTTGGSVASCVFPGSMQNTVFSSEGYAATSYEKIATYNRKDRLYVGPLTKSTYAIYAPEIALDWQLKTYPESLSYNYPFVVVSGNATFTAGTTGDVIIGRLRVVTCFEYSTVSTIVDTEPCLGSDNYYSATLQAVSMSGLCHENPEHKSWFQNILKSAGTVVSTLTKVLPAIGSVIETVGLAIV
jgi:hypothetical protein